MNAGPRPTMRLALGVAVILAVWFVALDARHLLPSDEGRYAEIAREMLASGDPVTVRYNGLLYFEKPPFHLWMTALAYRLFGLGDWQARLWAGLSGLVGIGATMLAARRWFGFRVGWASGLVLLAAPAWNLGGHFNSLDIGVSGALAAVLAAFLIAQHPELGRAGRRRWMAIAWFAMAIAVLTKGLIGIVLPGLVLAVYGVAARDPRLWTRLELRVGLPVFLVVTLPWFVAISLRHPAFPQFFFVHEHLQRYTSAVHRRDAPFWYFAPQLVLGFLPWLGLVPRAVAALRDDPRRDAAGPAFRPRLLLAVWAAAIVVFFSLSSSKLPGYMLPVYPALAVLAALALERIDARGWRRQLTLMTALATLGLVATPVLLRFGDEATPPVIYRSYALWLVATFATALAGLAIAWRLAAAGRRPASVAAAALAWFGAFTLAIAGHESFGRLTSGIDLVPPTLARLAPDTPIYAVRLLDHTLPFYLRRTTIMVEEPDELEFGTRQEPDKWLPTLAAFEARWRNGPHALAILAPETFEAFARDGLPMRVVARNPRRVVVENPAPVPFLPPTVPPTVPPTKRAR